MKKIEIPRFYGFETLKKELNEKSALFEVKTTIDSENNGQINYLGLYTSQKEPLLFFGFYKNRLKKGPYFFYSIYSLNPNGDINYFKIDYFKRTNSLSGKIEFKTLSENNKPGSRYYGEIIKNYREEIKKSIPNLEFILALSKHQVPFFNELNDRFSLFKKARFDRLKFKPTYKN